MRQQPAVFLLLLAASLLSMGARGAKPMYEPPAIPVPAGLTVEEISEAISDALTGRGWTVDNVKLAAGDEKSEIRTTLHIRVHELSIRFTFDTQRIEMEYVKSTNLGYREKKGKRYIHPKYTQWLNNLEADLRINLRK